eukprot:gb/GEZJ01003066.1/.p1 GENE.gb/GEZJ01003066.1/~~gb/GEZJ01003066.1/.p1  ORF type:complete len:195 (-),score=17.01 gb/GEZJ01003066.1/:1327-1911(-)
MCFQVLLSLQRSASHVMTSTRWKMKAMHKRSRKGVNRILSISGALLLFIDFCYRSSTRRKIRRDRRTFAEVCMSFTDSQFRSCYRVSRKTFRTILLRFRPFLSQFNEHDYDQEIETHRKGEAFEAATKLGIFLRFMSGASYWDLMTTYDVGRSTCYNVFQEVFAVCDEVLEFETLPPKSDVAQYYRSAMEFAVS